MFVLNPRTCSRHGKRREKSETLKKDEQGGHTQQVVVANGNIETPSLQLKHGLDEA